MGNVRKKGKIWKVSLLGIFFRWFVLTKLCLSAKNIPLLLPQITHLVEYFIGK